MTIHRCKSPFSTRINGVPRVVTGGELVDDSDPVFKGREAHFEAVETYVDRLADKRVSNVTVEQATAEPGELRQVSKPKRGPGRPRKAKADPEPVESTESE